MQFLYKDSLSMGFSYGPSVGLARSGTDTSPRWGEQDHIHMAEMLHCKLIIAAATEAFAPETKH